MKSRFALVVSLLAATLLVAASALAINYQNSFYVRNLGIQATAVTQDLPSVGATACVTATPTVNNVKAGDDILVALPNTASALVLQHQAIGTAANTILDKICNPTNVVTDPTSQTYIYFPIRPSGY